MMSVDGKRHTIKLLAIGLTSACLFGAATPASKALLAEIQPQVLAGLLYLGAAFGVLPVVIRTKSFRLPWHAGRRTFLLLAGAIFLGGILGPLLLLLGLTAASSGSVALWLNLEFVATAVLGHFVFREHLTARGWAAAGGTLLAALLLAGGEGGAGFLSVSLVAFACLCWGFDNHFTALIDGITPAQTTLWKGLVAGTFNLIVGGALGNGIGQLHVVLMALLVGAISYGVSVTLYIITSQGFGASRSQMVFSTAPFFGVLLSVAVLGETFTGTQALSTGIMGSLWCCSSPRNTSTSTDMMRSLTSTPIVIWMAITTTSIAVFRPRRAIRIGTYTTLWSTRTNTGPTCTIGMTTMTTRNLSRPTSRMHATVHSRA